MTDRSRWSSWATTQFEDGESRRIFEQELLSVSVNSLLTMAMTTQDVTQAELANRLGCTRQHVSQLLSGSRNMTLRTMADLSFSVGCRFEVKLGSIDAAEFEPMTGFSPIVIARGIGPVSAIGGDPESADSGEGYVPPNYGNFALAA